MPTPMSSYVESKVDGELLPARRTEGFDVLSTLSKGKKALLLAIFCFALFLDTFNNSSLFTAIPAISVQLNIPNSQSVWLLSAYQLTFASLLLVSGRVSDLYSPKWVFVIGAFMMAVFPLVGGFIRTEIPLNVIRALTGAGMVFVPFRGALTIPSSIHLIVHMYPDPSEQAKAITAFGGMGGVGLVLGLLIGALFVSFASWPWVFYFSAIVSALIGLSIALLVPNLKRTSETESRAEKLLRFRRLDLIGVISFTAALILFIFAITSGSIDGWRSAQVIAPLVLSFVLMVFFFVWESRLPESYAAIPSKMWKYENFAILMVISLAPFMWWSSIFLLFSWLWEVVYGFSAINTAVHFLPVGLAMFPVVPIAGAMQARLPLKWVILIGFFFICVGTVLLPFADSKGHYWPFAFPGFILGTVGASIIYTTANVALLATTPKEVSGIVSAMYMCVLQMGGAIGSAILTSIQTSVQISHGGPTSFSGRAAGFWFLFAFLILLGLLLLVLMKNTIGPVGKQGGGTTATDAENKDS
ncbi:major facilitator superfamily-domain-containing protein [Mycena albidolilacea]|uniref:Major facilitator superfamily-domain-containing protein n=1 Tax=Mycena albidolilacea TaxID=1033008 RepID=A0AAD6YY19_9AGAR|nr:major facilitator superfamily-domain-containing protein [Mycena albidolilacea]